VNIGLRRLTSYSEHSRVTHYVLIKTPKITESGGYAVATKWVYPVVVDPATKCKWTSNVKVYN